MTATLDAPPEYSPADLARAQLALADAVRELVAPGTERLDRAQPAHDPDVRETEAEHAARSAQLRAQHATALRHRHHAGARRALAALIAHEQQAHARRTTRAELPSLLEQLQDAVHSTQGHGAGASGPHRSPIGLDAAELLAHICAVVGAHPAQDLAARLRSWASLAGHWRAADPARLLHAASLAQRWVARAHDILEPQRPLDLVAACPACSTRTVHVPDDTGEIVRRPALQVDRRSGTARCAAHGCGEEWPPERLTFLARVLEEQAAA